MVGQKLTCFKGGESDGAVEVEVEVEVEVLQGFQVWKVLLDIKFEEELTTWKDLSFSSVLLGL